MIKTVTSITVLGFHGFSVCFKAKAEKIAKFDPTRIS